MIDHPRSAVLVIVVNLGVIKAMQELDMDVGHLGCRIGTKRDDQLSLGIVIVVRITPTGGSLADFLFHFVSFLPIRKAKGTNEKDRPPFGSRPAMPKLHMTIKATEY